MLPIEFIIDRFRATYHVASVLQPSWVWPVMSVANMGVNLAAIRAKLEAQETAETDLLNAREVLDNELADYRDAIRGYLRVGKLRYRSQRTKYNLLKPLRLAGTGRDNTLKVGRKVEKAWKKIDPAFVPVPNATFAAAHDCGQRCAQFLDDYSIKETEWRDKVQDTRDFAATLDQASVEWYATATTAFAAGTRYGDLIRVMVPTTSSAVQPVEQAVIDAATSPAAGQVLLEFHAPNATSYRLWHKAPGAAEWSLVAEEIDGLFYLVRGLTVVGQHRFQVAGRNSRGDGPVSTEAVVNVPVAAAA
jgi:hypothetical protein